METTTKDVSRVSIEGRVANYLTFLLCDIIETTSMVGEREAERVGYGAGKEILRLYNRIKYDCKDLRKFTRETSGQSQDEFGDTADEVLQLILLAIDRAGEKPERMDMIIRYLEGMESELGINIRKFGI